MMRAKVKELGSLKFFGVMAVLVVILGFALRFFAGDHLPQETTDKAEALYQYRQSYIGDASKLAAILEELPLAAYRGSIALQTEVEPYELTVLYDLRASQISQREISRSLQQNAAVVFALVDNASSVSFQLQGGEKEVYRFTRQAMAATFVQPLEQAAASAEDFRQFFQDAQLEVEVWPREYTLAMSSAPGMRLRPLMAEEATQAEYFADQGEFTTWEAASGALTSQGNRVTLPAAAEVYWTPGQAQGLVDQRARVEVVLRDGQGARMAMRQLMIAEDGGFYRLFPAD